MSEFEFEKNKVSDTLKVIGDFLISEKEELKEIKEEYSSNKEELLKLISIKENHINNLEYSLEKPYFARIDFQSDSEDKKNTIYIGKNGIGKDGDIVVTDWRAPISSLYYESDLGTCSFEVSNKIIKGNMSLKRQFEIELGELQNFFDVDLTSSDKLLQKYLNSNNDTRLKSIVATIQKEQNIVIRKKINDNIIIQGVAGSGKTTVALHRIAYLVYNYMKNIKKSEYLVIGPNPVFLKYIKSVLPELDVDSIMQVTFEDYAKNYIEEDIKVLSSEQKVVDILNKNKYYDYDLFKSSLKYKSMLDKFFDLYISTITKDSLYLGDFEILPSSIILKEFTSSFDEYTKDLSNRVEKTIERLTKYIKQNYNKILQRYNEYSFNLFANETLENKKIEYKKMFKKDLSELDKYCKSTLRKYFNKVKLSPLKLYKMFLDNIEDFDIYNYPLLSNLKKDTLNNIKKNVVSFEDLAALVYLKSKVKSIEYYKNVRHVVIDEAQDLGEFNFFVLKYTLENSTFSIFGDLAQSIYDYRSINSWSDALNAMNIKDMEIINFNKSYRTTKEIMMLADSVASFIGLEKSEEVIRSGNMVQLTNINNDKIKYKYIIDKVNKYQSMGYKSIAIISKNENTSNKLNEDLRNYGLDIPNVSLTSDLTSKDYLVCTISNQLAKGLEFDAVIINNASEEEYVSTNKLDMKLLYVALTRALHELDIIYSGNITKPLEDYI